MLWLTGATDLLLLVRATLAMGSLVRHARERRTTV
jgi:hypothetical protein